MTARSISRIAVPLDGSTFGEAALPVAVSIARQAEATVRVAHVHTRQPPGVRGEVVPGLKWDAEERRHMDEVYVQGLADAIAAGGVSALPVLLHGRPGEAITRYAADDDIDLIVMSTHGYGPFSRAWLGSVADYVMRTAGVPVLLVRPQTGVQSGVDRGEPFHHILVPLDGSALAESILEHALSLARLSSAAVTLIAVVRPGGDDPPDVIPAGDADAPTAAGRMEQYLDRTRAGIGGDVVTDGLVIADASPAAAIDRAARDRGVDLIALATHGRGGVKRLIIGSTADKVLRGADRAVLLYRPTI